VRAGVTGAGPVGTGLSISAYRAEIKTESALDELNAGAARESYMIIDFEHSLLKRYFTFTQRFK